MSHPSENVDQEVAPESGPLEVVAEPELKLLPVTVEIKDGGDEKESKEKAKKASELVHDLADMEVPPPYTVTLKDGDGSCPAEKKVQKNEGLQGHAVVL